MKNKFLLGVVLGICAVACSKAPESAYKVEPKDNPGLAQYGTSYNSTNPTDKAKLNGKESRVEPTLGESDLMAILNQNFEPGVTFDNLMKYLEEISKKYMFKKIVDSSNNNLKYIFLLNTYVEPTPEYHWLNPFHWFPQFKVATDSQNKTYRLDLIQQSRPERIVIDERTTTVSRAELAIYRIELVNIELTNPHYWERPSYPSWDWLKLRPNKTWEPITIKLQNEKPQFDKQQGLLCCVRTSNSLSGQRDGKPTESDYSHGKFLIPLV